MRRSSNSSLSIRRSGSWHMTSRRSRETAAGVLPASGMPQAAETAEAPAGASAPKAAVRLAGTGVPGAAGMPAGTARPDAIAPTSKRESARSAVSAGMQPVLSFEIQRR